jgi:predicted DNA-binding transcriptional regulator AlpA
MATARPDPKGLVDLLTSQQVADRLSISVRTLWRLVARGSFPPPIRYSRKLVRWKTVEVDRYVQELSARVTP